MSPQQRVYYQERACLERELAKSAPDRLMAILHLEIAARYEALTEQRPRPQLRLVVDNGASRIKG